MLINIIFMPLESENRLERVCENISKIHSQLGAMWKEYNQRPSESLLGEITTLEECLVDYQQEFNELIGD